MLSGDNREWNGVEMVQVENKTLQWFGASLDASSSAAHSTAIVVVRLATNIQLLLSRPNLTLFINANRSLHAVRELAPSSLCSTQYNIPALGYVSI